MRTTENTSDIRTLTDAELDAVSGGEILLAAAFAIAAIAGWEIGKRMGAFLTAGLPDGMSVEQAAQIAGCGHLL